jgi:hypothetical protein
MASEAVAVLTVLVLVIAAVAFALSRRPSGAPGDELGLPDVLRGARVVHAEQTFRSTARGLVARLDRAYELDGELVLVEFKTRRADAAYMADILELSVQRVALQDDRLAPVSRTAWVVTQNSVTAKRRAHRVSLLETQEVLALRERYLQIETGSGTPPRPAPSPKRCVNCGHNAICGPGGKGQTLERSRCA